MMMFADYFSQYIDDCPVLETYDIEMTENDKKAAEKIHKASSVDEIAGIISDELVRSLIGQIKL